MEISLYEPIDGEKTIVGKLVGLSEDGSQLLLEGETPETGRSIERKKIARVRLYIEI